jgi:prephenate dehydratase
VPGALHKVLTYFAEADIQLTKVESRPTQAWLGDYVFLIDFEGHRDDPHVARAIERAREACATLTVFGSYPRFPLESLRSVVAAAGFPNGSKPPR